MSQCAQQQTTNLHTISLYQ